MDLDPSPLPVEIFIGIIFEDQLATLDVAQYETPKIPAVLRLWTVRLLFLVGLDPNLQGSYDPCPPDLKISEMCSP
jgi:hypothetical protein